MGEAKHNKKKATSIPPVVKHKTLCGLFWYVLSRLCTDPSFVSRFIVLEHGICVALRRIIHVRVI